MLRVGMMLSRENVGFKVAFSVLGCYAVCVGSFFLPTFWESLLVPSSTTNQHCVTTQNTEDLIYSTAES
jgi:hypothetical protein